MCSTAELSLIGFKRGPLKMGSMQKHGAERSPIRDSLLNRALKGRNISNARRITGAMNGIG